MQPHIEDMKEKADQARALYRMGKITRDEATEAISPYAEKFNAKSKELARKYGQRHKPFSISSYLR